MGGTFQIIQVRPLPYRKLWFWGSPVLRNPPWMAMVQTSAMPRVNQLKIDITELGDDLESLQKDWGAKNADGTGA